MHNLGLNREQRLVPGCLTVTRERPESGQSCYRQGQSAWFWNSARSLGAVNELDIQGPGASALGAVRGKEGRYRWRVKFWAGEVALSEVIELSNIHYAAGQVAECLVVVFGQGHDV